MTLGFECFFFLFVCLFVCFCVTENESEITERKPNNCGKKSCYFALKKLLLSYL